MRLAKQSVVCLCRTWAGLISVSSDPHCLRALLSTLFVAPEERGHLILDALFELLCMPHLTRDSASEPGKADRSLSNPGTGGRPALAGGGGTGSLPDLVLRYVVIVLQALMHCGLLQVLNWLPTHAH
jgi:hypothetical protein